MRFGIGIGIGIEMERQFIRLKETIVEPMAITIAKAIARKHKCYSFDFPMIAGINLLGANANINLSGRELKADGETGGR